MPRGPGAACEDTVWDDPLLPSKVERFRPDLLLVVHGRRFAEKWRDRFKAVNTAVWLVDEPYEVDDTAKWSGRLRYRVHQRPGNTRGIACALPAGLLRPGVHRADGAERPHLVGFIGGYNATRERFLVRLADAGLLAYVVGGPWRSPALRRLCLASNVPASRAALLYRRTEIVVNVFRETHHFNARTWPPR